MSSAENYLASLAISQILFYEGIFLLCSYKYQIFVTEEIDRYFPRHMGKVKDIYLPVKQVEAHRFHLSVCNKAQTVPFSNRDGFRIETT